MLSFVHFQKYYVSVSHSASSQKPMYRSEGKKYRLTELIPGARPWLSLVFIGCSWILGGASTAIYLKPLYWSDFDKEHYLICSYLKHGLDILLRRCGLRRKMMGDALSFMLYLIWSGPPVNICRKHKFFFAFFDMYAYAAYFRLFGCCCPIGFLDIVHRIIGILIRFYYQFEGV